MKIQLILILSLITFSTYGQDHMVIEGGPSDIDTLLIVRATTVAAWPVIAVAAFSYANNGRGGYFFGKSRGIKGEGGSEGVYGRSYFPNGYGIYGEGGNDGTGAYFEGGGGIAIELGGANSAYGAGDDDSVIRTQENLDDGDLILVSNDYIDFHLDDNDDNSSEMRVKNGDDAEIFTLTEAGNLTLSGSCSCSSDRNRKEKIISINAKEILTKISTLPIKEWHFKGEEIRHIGPMAQDFYAAFGLGQGETTIATVDADGVALAAIQALHMEVDHLKQEIEQLKKLLSTTNSFVAKGHTSPKAEN